VLLGAPDPPLAVGGATDGVPLAVGGTTDDVVGLVVDNVSVGTKFVYIVCVVVDSTLLPSHRVLTRLNSPGHGVCGSHLCAPHSAREFQ